MILEKNHIHIFFVPGVSGGGSLKYLLPGVVDIFSRAYPKELEVAVLCHFLPPTSQRHRILSNQKKKHESSHTVDGRNPANHLGRMGYVLFTSIYHINWLAGFLPSTVSST